MVLNVSVLSISNIKKSYCTVFNWTDTCIPIWDWKVSGSFVSLSGTYRKVCMWSGVWWLQYILPLLIDCHKLYSHFYFVVNNLYSTYPRIWTVYLLFTLLLEITFTQRNSPDNQRSTSGMCKKKMWSFFSWSTLLLIR